MAFPFSPKTYMARSPWREAPRPALVKRGASRAAG